MAEDRSYVEENTRERERLRRLVESLDDDRLRSQVNEYWTVAGVFGHIAFWDARILALSEKLERGVPFSPADTEPEDVDWINDASRPLIHAVEPRELARLALEIAEQTDAKVATLPPDRLWPTDPDSPIYATRSSHRGEHLDEVEAALRGASR
jgi:Mycothiol maleylpyruvate isomerase N-terminal domain